MNEETPRGLIRSVLRSAASSSSERNTTFTTTRQTARRQTPSRSSEKTANTGQRTLSSKRPAQSSVGSSAKRSRLSLSTPASGTTPRTTIKNFLETANPQTPAVSSTQPSTSSQETKSLHREVNVTSSTTSQPRLAISDAQFQRLTGSSPASRTSPRKGSRSSKRLSSRNESFSTPSENITPRVTIKTFLRAADTETPTERPQPALEEMNTQPSAEMSTQPLAEMSTQPSAEMSTQPSAEMSTQPSADMSTQPSAEMSTQPSAEMSTQPSAEMSSQPSAEMSTQPSADMSTQPSAEMSTQPSAEISSQPSAEMSTQPSAEVSTQPAAEISTEAELPREISIQSRQSDEINSQPLQAINSQHEIEHTPESPSAGMDEQAQPNVSDVEVDSSVPEESMESSNVVENSGQASNDEVQYDLPDTTVRVGISTSHNSSSAGWSNLQTPVLLHETIVKASPVVLGRPPIHQQQRKVPTRTKKNVGEKQAAVTNKNLKSERFPVGLVKGIFEHFSSMPVSKEALQAIQAGSDSYFKKLSSDLVSYCKHAKRKTIENADVELLMHRQGLITPTMSFHALLEKYLPLEYRQELIPIATAGNKVVPKQK